MTTRLRKRCREICGFDMMKTMELKKRLKLTQIILPYIFSLTLVALVTLLGEFIKRHLEPTNLVMLYLLVVLIIAMKWGRGPAVWASILSTLAFDFFLIPPYLTLAVADVEYIFTFIGLFTVGIIVSELMVKAREHAKKAKQLELLRAIEKLHTSLLNSVSHDLRTPLVSIKGTLSMLLHDASWLDEETRNGLVENAFEQSDRLNRLVGNLLDITRVEAGALKVSLKPCDLRDIVGVSLEELNDKLKNRFVDVQIPDDFPELSVDFSLIAKVFVNLIDNAIKYSPEESPIQIQAKMQENEVKIEVSDEGIGIPEKDLKRIFGKFYRTERSNQKRGLGLGLSICKGIVEVHQGKIWAENRRDKKGTAFNILLPIKAGIHEE